MKTLPPWIKSWIRPTTLWHQQVDNWLCTIDPGPEEFPFLFHVQCATQGYGGPAQSFEEARRRIEDFLHCKGLSLPMQQNKIPGLTV